MGIAKRPPFQACKAQSALVVLEFHICEFASMLKFICDPRIETPAAFMHMRRTVKILGFPMRLSPLGLEQACAPSASFPSHAANKDPCCSLSSAIFFFFGIFSLFVSDVPLIKTPLRPKHSAGQLKMRFTRK